MHYPCFIDFDVLHRSGSWPKPKGSFSWYSSIMRTPLNLNSHCIQTWYTGSGQQTDFAINNISALVLATNNNHISSVIFSRRYRSHQRMSSLTLRWNSPSLCLSPCIISIYSEFGYSKEIWWSLWQLWMNFSPNYITFSQMYYAIVF